MKRLAHGLDTCQPLDGRHSIMSGDNRADWKPVISRKLPPVHLVSDQDFRPKCLGPGQAPGIGYRYRRHGFFFRRAAIRTFEHDLAGIIGQAGALQQRSKGHPGPFCVADRSELPLCPLHLGDEKDPTIACAFQSRDAGLRWHAAQLVVT